MAINKNHEFEELGGVKCAIVEKGASPARTAFLKDLLELNRYTIVVVPAAPPKAAATPPPVDGVEQPAPPPTPELFTVGVTDLSFNPVNAIFGRVLRTKDGSVVTLHYWQQKEAVPRDEIPYFEKR